MSTRLDRIAHLANKRISGSLLQAGSTDLSAGSCVIRIVEQLSVCDIHGHMLPVVIDDREPRSGHLSAIQYAYR